MNLLRDLPSRDARGNVHVVVETPGGSAVKLKYDEARDVFVWSRALSLGVRFPYDYGFVPRTLADDGDALDALVYNDAPSFAGVVVPSRIVGALRVEQMRPGQRVKRNDRIIAIPSNAHRWSQVTEVADLPDRVRDELEEFFRASLALTGKKVAFKGWADAAETAEIVARSERAFGH